LRGGADKRRVVFGGFSAAKKEVYKNPVKIGGESRSLNVGMDGCDARDTACIIFRVGKCHRELRLRRVPDYCGDAD